MAEILEYDYYDASLTVTIHTPRPEAVPSTVFVAGTVHNDYLSRVRGALREKRGLIDEHLPVSEGFPLYNIRKVSPAGSLRAVDEDFFLEVTSQRFDLGIAVPPSAWVAGEEIALGFERHIERAVHDAFRALGLPHLVIPGDADQIGESFIEIKCELGPATNQGLINDANP